MQVSYCVLTLRLSRGSERATGNILSSGQLTVIHDVQQEKVVATAGIVFKTYLLIKHQGVVHEEKRMCR
jgi:hypothetical protein